MATANTTTSSMIRPLMIQSPTWPKAAWPPSAGMLASSTMPDLIWNQPTVAKISISATFLRAVTICCLEKTLPRPEMGLMRLNCGMMGLRL